MKVLVVCEFSGVVREAFRKCGHDAWSCDLLPASDGSRYHYQMDAVGLIERSFKSWRRAANPKEYIYRSEWDLVIAHPPCTFLAVSGARWFKVRQSDQAKAIEFAQDLWECGIPKIAIENPIGVLSTRSSLGKPDQIIQPWMFGHGETKATCLWLRGLPKLQPTSIVAGRIPRVHHESPRIINGLTRQQRRSITLQGVADAMAEQWG